MIPRQSYAPTPHSYVPNTHLSATINLDEVSPFPAATPLSPTPRMDAVTDAQLAVGGETDQNTRRTRLA
jgi:hypothetical protein